MPELSIVVIILLLLLISFIFFKYSLKDLKRKSDLYKQGKLNSKHIDRLVKRMNMFGKFRFYCFQGIFIWGLLTSIFISTMEFLIDKFIEKDNVLIIDYTSSFIVQFVGLSILGLLYARSVWKLFHV